MMMKSFYDKKSINNKEKDKNEKSITGENKKKSSTNTKID